MAVVVSVLSTVLPRFWKKNIIKGLQQALCQSARLFHVFFQSPPGFVDSSTPHTIELVVAPCPQRPRGSVQALPPPTRVDGPSLLGTTKRMKNDSEPPCHTQTPLRLPPKSQDWRAPGGNKRCSGRGSPCGTAALEDPGTARSAPRRPAEQGRSLVSPPSPRGYTPKHTKTNRQGVNHITHATRTDY